MDGPHKRLIFNAMSERQIPKRELQNKELRPIGDNVRGDTA